MDANVYQRLAERTECDQEASGWRIQEGGLPVVRLLHAAIGLTSDAGEFAAGVERYVYYGHNLDTVNLLEELGDCLWYIAQACNALEVSLSSVMDANIAKLRRRYPGQFDDQQAEEEHRDRAAERAALEAFACPTCGTDERVPCEAPGLSGICAGHTCPACRTPISDEVVKQLYLGSRVTARCPACDGPFYFDLADARLHDAESRS